MERLSINSNASASVEEAVITICFDGTICERNTFLQTVIDFLYNRLAVYERRHILLMVIKEMIKNIYDHAGGKGKAVFVLQADQIRFEVSNKTTKEINADLFSQRGYSTGNSGINFGLGMSIIRDMCATDEFADFSIDTKNGLKCSGTFLKHKSP